MSRQSRERRRTSELKAPFPKEAKVDATDSEFVATDVWQDLAAPGQPLAIETRERMQTYFGHDFSNVRVHADPEASRIASQLGAAAFTIGQDIGFAEGMYQPNTSAGQRLIAHELTHVIQQHPRSGARNSDSVGEGVGSKLEAEAARASMGVARGWKAESPGPEVSKGVTGQPIIQRSTETDTVQEVEAGDTVPKRDEDWPPPGADLDRMLHEMSLNEPFLADMGSANRDEINTGTEGPIQLGPPGRDPGPYREPEGQGSATIWFGDQSPEDIVFHRMSTPHGDYWYPYYLEDLAEPRASNAVRLQKVLTENHRKVKPLLAEIGASEEYSRQLSEIDIGKDVAGNASVDTAMHARSFGMSLELSERVKSLEDTLRTDYAQRYEVAAERVESSNRLLKRLMWSKKAADLRARGEALAENLQARKQEITFVLDLLSAGVSRDPIAVMKLVSVDIIPSLDDFNRHSEFLLAEATRLEADVAEMEWSDASDHLRIAVKELKNIGDLRDRLESQSTEILTDVAEARGLIEYRFDQESEGIFNFGRLEEGIASADELSECALTIMQTGPKAMSAAYGLRLERYVAWSPYGEDMDVSHLLDVEGNRRISSALATDAAVWLADAMPAYAKAVAVGADLRSLRDSGFEALRGLTRADLEGRDGRKSSVPR